MVGKLFLVLVVVVSLVSGIVCGVGTLAFQMWDKK